MPGHDCRAPDYLSSALWSSVPVPTNAGGYELTKDRQDAHTLQHENIQHTVRYTELLPDRFKSGEN